MVSGLVGVLMVAACQQSHNSISIGTIYNLEGTQAILDVESARGARMAFAEIDAEGGVSGRKVQQFEARGVTEAGEVHDATATLLARNPEILTVIGLSDTDMAKAAAGAVTAFDRVFITSGATSPRLPSEFPGHVFLACYGDNVQAAAAAEWMYRDLAARDILVLYDDTFEFTRLLTGYFRKSWKDISGKDVSAIKVDPQSPDVLRESFQGVDAIYLGLQTAESAIGTIRALRAAGFEGPIIGADGFDARSTWEKNVDISGVYFTTHGYFGVDSPDPQARAFGRRFEKMYPGDTPTAFAGLGYDTVRLAVLASRNAITANDVAQTLSGISAFKGVTGTLSYTEGSVPRKTVTILNVKAGTVRYQSEIMPEFVSTP